LENLLKRSWDGNRRKRERERERDAPWSMVAKQAYLSVGYIMSTKTSETPRKTPSLCKSIRTKTSEPDSLEAFEAVGVRQSSCDN